MGRPTKLTPELTDAICADLAEGLYLETAAEAAGVHRATVYAWLDKGAQGVEPYAAFHDAVTRARADGTKGLFRTVAGGDRKGVSFGPAKAAMELLGRTRPEYALRVNHKVESAVEEVLEVVRRVCSPEDFARVLEELARAGREGGEPAADGDPGTESTAFH